MSRHNSFPFPYQHPHIYVMHLQTLRTPKKCSWPWKGWYHIRLFHIFISYLIIFTHPTSRVLPGLLGRLKISSDVIPNSLAPGMSGYLGLPPVAMIKFLAEIFFSLPFLSTVLSECGSTKVATGELNKISLSIVRYPNLQCTYKYSSIWPPCLLAPPYIPNSSSQCSFGFPPPFYSNPNWN